MITGEKEFSEILKNAITLDGERVFDLWMQAKCVHNERDKEMISELAKENGYVAHFNCLGMFYFTLH